MRKASLETLSWGFAVVTLLSCGGGTSGGGGKPSAEEVKDLCGKLCQKLATCTGLPAQACVSSCSDNSTGTGAIPPECNTRDVFNQVNACVNGECSTFTTCLTDATNQCQTATGGSSSTGGARSTGGSTSNGGSTSTGGAGSADCSVCSKANTCCVALATAQGVDASSCANLSAATCMSAGTAQATLVMACQQTLTIGAAQNIPACK
jgi:hypothetical protein